MKRSWSKPLEWLPRRKRGLGVGFSDFLSRASRPSRKRIREETGWQELFLPQERIAGEETRFSSWAGVLAGLVVAAVALIFAGRLWQLQIVQGQDNLQASQGNRVRIRSIPAPRGVIYDRNGYILANNVPGFRLVAEVIGVKTGRLNELADFLAESLGTSSADMKTKLIYSGQSENIITSGLSRDQAISLELKLPSYPELRVVEEPIRSYPNGEVLAHLLGYLGEIGPEELKDPKYSGLSAGTRIGRSGIEESYDFLLRGQDGKELVEVDSRGRTERVVAREDPKPGRNIVLTVDLGLTKTLSDDLKKQIAVAHSQKGALVAVNPQDGSVLAYASFPSFDPNLFSRPISQADYDKLSQNTNQPLFDRVISGVYPPGSTFKPTVATAALTEKVTTKDRLIASPGVVYLGTQAFHNWRPSGFGNINIVDSIGWSNDIYFYYMGAELGVDRLSSWANKFGFGEKTGINLPGENAGLVPTQKWKEDIFNQVWYPGESYIYGIGQGYLLVSPIQLVMDVSAIGNGGRLYQPILIKEVRDSSNLVVSRDNPVLKRDHLAEPDVLSTVKEGMKKSCTIFVNLAGDDGCKTGSAEFGSPDQPTHAWFAAFAPLENPVVAIAILIEGGGHGSIVSSPVARPLLAPYLNK